MSEKSYLILKVLLTGILIFIVSVGCVALAWNVILTYLFDFIPKLSFGRLCLLTIAITLLHPINLNKRS